MAATAPFEAAYAAWPICPSNAEMLEVLMITPRSPLDPSGSGVAAIRSAQSLRTLNVPTVFTLSIWGMGGD